MCPHLHQVQSYWHSSLAFAAVCFVTDVFIAFVISVTIAMIDYESNSQTLTLFLVTTSIVCSVPLCITRLSGVYFDILFVCKYICVHVTIFVFM